MSTPHHPVSVYAELQDKAFSMHVSAEQRLPVQLIEVEDLGDRPTPDGPVSSYSLVFRSDGEKRGAPQGTYRLEHAELGTLELFLVPIGPDKQGMRYQAVFG